MTECVLVSMNTRIQVSEKGRGLIYSSDLFYKFLLPLLILFPKFLPPLLILFLKFLLPLLILFLKFLLPLLILFPKFLPSLLILYPKFCKFLLPLLIPFPKFPKYLLPLLILYPKFCKFLLPSLILFPKFLFQLFLLYPKFRKFLFQLLMVSDFSPKFYKFLFQLLMLDELTIALAQPSQVRKVPLGFTHIGLFHHQLPPFQFFDLSTYQRLHPFFLPLYFDLRQNPCFAQFPPIFFNTALEIGIWTHCSCKFWFVNRKPENRLH